MEIAIGYVDEEWICVEVVAVVSADAGIPIAAATVLDDAVAIGRQGSGIIVHLIAIVFGSIAPKNTVFDGRVASTEVAIVV